LGPPQLRLELLDFGPALVEFFIWREKGADDEQPDGDKKQHAQNMIHALPDGSLASRPKIAVTGGVH